MLMLLTAMTSMAEERTRVEKLRSILRERMERERERTVLENLRGVE